MYESTVVTPHHGEVALAIDTSWGIEAKLGSANHGLRLSQISGLVLATLLQNPDTLHGGKEFHNQAVAVHDRMVEEHGAMELDFKAKIAEIRRKNATRGFNNLAKRSTNFLDGNLLRLGPDRSEKWFVLISDAGNREISLEKLHASVLDVPDAFRSDVEQQIKGIFTIKPLLSPKVVVAPIKMLKLRPASKDRGDFQDIYVSVLPLEAGAEVTVESLIFAAKSAGVALLVKNANDILDILERNRKVQVINDPNSRNDSTVIHIRN
jgi:hypothetical protein